MTHLTQQLLGAIASLAGLRLQYQLIDNKLKSLPLWP